MDERTKETQTGTGRTEDGGAESRLCSARNVGTKRLGVANLFHPGFAARNVGTKRLRVASLFPSAVPTPLLFCFA